MNCPTLISLPGPPGVPLLTAAAKLSLLRTARTSRPSLVRKISGDWPLRLPGPYEPRCCPSPEAHSPDGLASASARYASTSATSVSICLVSASTLALRSAYCLSSRRRLRPLLGQRELDGRPHIGNQAGPFLPRLA